MPGFLSLASPHPPARCPPLLARLACGGLLPAPPPPGPASGTLARLLHPPCGLSATGKEESPVVGAALLQAVAEACGARGTAAPTPFPDL